MGYGIYKYSGTGIYSTAFRKQQQVCYPVPDQYYPSDCRNIYGYDTGLPDLHTDLPAGMYTIHFGIMMIFNLCIGTITPPVGTTLFVGVKVGKVQIETVFRQLLVYFAAIFIVLMLVTYIPNLSLWLPKLMGYI